MEANKSPFASRQKMINLMYIVLMALLALNVPVGVLVGFELVSENLERSLSVSEARNMRLYEAIEVKMGLNPVKTAPWYKKALEVKAASDSLFSFVEDIKETVARECDGKNADVEHLKNPENLNASRKAVLDSGKGMKLFAAVNCYRDRMAALIDDSSIREVVERNLSTRVPDRRECQGKNWEEYMFGSVPAAASVALMTKLQNDIRYTECEVLHSLMDRIDVKDVRMNRLQAFVIPESETVIQGGRLKARIVLAAIDSTSKPAVYVDGEQIPAHERIFERTCHSAGEFSLDGYIELKGNGGETIIRPFSQPYSVIPPFAAVSADMMNVLYAGIDNPISLSVPGVPMKDVRASITGGRLKQQAPGRYIVRPDAVGKEVSVLVQYGGRLVTRQKFRVRKLPEPTPFLVTRNGKGQLGHFKGGRISRTELSGAMKVGAAVDDGLLHVPFTVVSFELVFIDSRGDFIPFASDGDRLSGRQMDALARLARGRRCYISNVTAKGPDGTTRKLASSLEVTVN